MATKSDSERALDTLDSIPADFVDDGCSNSPDSIFCTTIAWACRIHDWRYCTRAHPEDTMSKKHRKEADKELRRHLCAALPWYLEWVRWIYYRAVRRFGTLSAYDTCGPFKGERCRHNMLRPPWMAAEMAILQWNAMMEDT